MKQYKECSNYLIVKGKGIILLYFVLLFCHCIFLSLATIIATWSKILRAYQALPRYLENVISNYLGITQTTCKILVESM